MRLKTFSFHNRNERTATKRQKTWSAENDKLSVSTIGTNELQRHFHFIISFAACAFSFHNRNERTATKFHQIGTRARCAFQFPQSERTNCNCGYDARNPQRNRLSVSTIGTNELQHIWHTRRYLSDFFLSVSTIGTNELQQWRGKSIRRAACNFQFPQSERTNCNIVLDWGRVCTGGTFSFHNRNERTATFHVTPRVSIPAALSVSTIGTNELQRPCYANTRIESRLSVSTIGTNELQQMRVAKFGLRMLVFQFPQSERTNCNLVSKCEQPYQLRPFSFHNRNERTATRNLTRRLRRSSKLSVSTIGTNELQLSNSHPLPARLHLSVSTIGTNELQPLCRFRIAARAISFSFHNRNERTATVFGATSRREHPALSVSTIGTNELQPFFSNARMSD